MVIYGERIALRTMEERDTADIIRWRNTDFVRKNFIYQKPFTAETHHHWIETMVKTGKVVQFMICPYEADTENEAAQEEPGRQGQTADTGLKIIQNAVGSVYLRDIDETHHKAEYGIFIGEEEIVTTADHPFWVEGKGFVPAMSLVIDSELLNNSGNVVRVDNLLRETNADGAEVYNFKVDEYHTYYVGDMHILVHNAGDAYSRPSGFRKGVRDKAWEEVEKASPDGIVHDPKTGRPMSKDEPWDMGHKPGYEFRKHRASARERGITRKQFLDEHNNPSRYRPELPSSNRSHVCEDLTDLYLRL